MSLKNEISTLNNFTQIRNDILNNCLLTGREKGVLSYLISKPTGWDFSCIRIANDFSEGVRSIKSSLKILEQEQWLIRRKLRTGRMVYTIKYGNIKLFKHEPCVLEPHKAPTAHISKTDLKKERIKDITLEQVPSAPPVKYKKIDKKIAKLHYNEVKAAHPRSTSKFNKDEWANSVRLLREVNNYTSGEIAATLEFARLDNFWKDKCHSIPALRGRSRNGLIKFENIFSDYKGAKFTKNEASYDAIAFSSKALWPDNESQHHRCVKICDGITSVLKDSFKDENKKNKLIDLVDTIEHMTSYGQINLWRSYREGKPVLFSQGDIQCRPEEAYPNFIKKAKGDFVGFKDITLDTALFAEFEDFVCSRRMHVNSTDAKDELLGKKFPSHKKRIHAWKKYLKEMDQTSDNYYFTR